MNSAFIHAKKAFRREEICHYAFLGDLNELMTPVNLERMIYASFLYVSDNADQDLASAALLALPRDGDTASMARIRHTIETVR